MQPENYIAVREFCHYHDIEADFIHSLQSYGLLHITTIQETDFLDPDDLTELEKMIRLHYDLDINIEGIEAISHLVRRMEGLQHELEQLRNRLSRYE